MQFRQKALAKLQSPEELDLPVRYARPQGGLVLAVTIVVMAVAAFWAVTGSVSSKLTSPGILTHPQGSYVLQSPVAGQVTQIYAKEGQQLRAGAPVLKVRTAQGDRAVRAVAPGRVTSLVGKIGSVVTMGADVASVERVQSAHEPLVAMVYVPSRSAATVPVGADVDLTVQSVPTQQYGVLRGKVKAVGRAPQSSRQIAGFLGDRELGEQFTADGQPIAVLVELERGNDTKSGYKWSTADGPPNAIGSMTPVTGAIHLTAQRPIDWLLP